MTDLTLKKALCGMLPEQIIHIHNSEVYEYEFMWRAQHGNRGVLDTELLHIAWLVTKELNKVQLHILDTWHQKEWDESGTHLNYYAWLLLMTWQQRTIALCKVKEITLDEKE